MKKLLAVLAAVLAVPAIALAHDDIFIDADDSAGKLDIKTVEVSHPDSGTIRFVVTFYEPHMFSGRIEHESGDWLQISLRLDGEPPWRFKSIRLRGNPDGSLYGVLTNHEGEELSYVRAWRQDEMSLAIDVRRTQLKRRGLASRADWVIDTLYIDREVCPAEPGDVPSSCIDVAPENRWQLHDL